ncbi:DNA methyltransferase [Paraburkholderia strydomiana]|uniref:DNA methyltransferase n=1 Tax=Paraburkholderia strydomiana TaxID=1245417 RepID=UPI0038B913BA
MKGLQGRAIVKPNDHPDIRALFADFEHERVEIQYTVGGGSGNTVSRGELVIYSWDRTENPVGLF